MNNTQTKADELKAQSKGKCVTYRLVGMFNDDSDIYGANPTSIEEATKFAVEFNANPEYHYELVEGTKNYIHSIYQVISQDDSVDYDSEGKLVWEM